MHIFNEKDKFDLETLSKIIERPELFSQGDRQNFWDDGYISKNLLEAHLNRDWDAASRKYETIRNTCKWMVDTLNLKEGMKIIDLGCGPGLYCSELYKYGLQITGVDFSQRSIDYAKKYAQDNKMTINYFYKNYLTLDYENEFNMVMLVYYDFACFSKSDTKELLRVIYNMLKTGGYFVFDIQTPNAKGFGCEETKWSINNGGFWRQNRYIELYQKLYYPNSHTRLDHHIIIDENGEISEFRLWERHYFLKDIEELVKEAGFSIEGVFSDLTGTPYRDDSKAIGLVVRK